MSILFIEYPKCTTCIRAKKFLKENEIDFEDRHIVDNKPSKDELKEWLDKSGLMINKFFNTSGKLYREMELKNKVKLLNNEQLLEILALDGMLVKRPIIVTDKKVLVGFKEEDWIEVFKK